MLYAVLTYTMRYTALTYGMHYAALTYAMLCGMWKGSAIQTSKVVVDTLR